MITFSAPNEINSLARFTERTPPPVRTFPLRRSFFNNGVFTVSPFGFVFPKAASKSITATSPYLLKSLIKESESSLSITGSFPFFNWTTCPPFKSIEEITIMKKYTKFYK